jgi:hypothetical protein
MQRSMSSYGHVCTMKIESSCFWQEHFAHHFAWTTWMGSDFDLGNWPFSCGRIVIQLCKSHTKRFTRFTLFCAPRQSVGLSCACYLSILDKKGSTTLILHPYSFPLSKARLEEVFSTRKSSNAPNVDQGLQLGKKTKHFAINSSILLLPQVPTQLIGF